MSNAILANNYDADFLSNRFTENMEYFKTKDISIFEKFISYEAGPNKLGIDDLGQFNILCGEGWLYPKDIKSILEDQFRIFHERKPSLTTVEQDNDVMPDSVYITNKGINKHYHDELLNQSPAHTDHMLSPIVIALGSGLGYQFGDLLKQNPLKLVIYEPHDDFFYASLFICNYPALEKAFEHKSDQNISFVIGQNEIELLRCIGEISLSNQQHYLAKAQMFQHYTNDALTRANQLLVDQYPFMVTKGGFLEDSVIGLNHMDIKMQNRMRFLKHNKSKKNVPVLIIASGPSIDTLIDTIASQQDKFIIISCSSSIQICHKSGIIPDFHVESERGYNTFQNLALLENTELLKKTVFLTSNMIHPDAPNYFKDTIYTLKPNELGTDIYVDLLQKKNNNIIGLNHSGPTSGNAAVAYAVELGFESIYLAGFDCAYLSTDYHHSKKSIYYTHQLQNTATNSSYHVKGVDGNLLFTNYLLDNSRLKIENLTKEHPEIEFYNLSLGAHIANSTHLKLDSFVKIVSSEKTKTINKRNVLNSILQTNSTELSLNKQDKQAINQIKNNIINDYSASIKVICDHLKKSKKSYASFFKTFEDINSFSKSLHPIQNHLIDCTLYNMTICMATALLKTDNIQEQNSYLDRAYSIFQEFLYAGLHLLQHQQFVAENKLDYKRAIDDAAQQIKNTHVQKVN